MKNDNLTNWLRSNELRDLRNLELRKQLSNTVDLPIDLKNVANTVNKSLVLCCNIIPWEMQLNYFILHWKSNYLCALMDMGNEWKSFATHTSTSITKQCAVDSNLIWKSPSRELLLQWKNDSTATIEHLIEIFQKMNFDDGISVVISWKDDTPLNIYRYSMRYMKRKVDNMDGLEKLELPGQYEYELGMVWYWKDLFRESIPYFEKSAKLQYPPSLLQLFLVFTQLKELQTAELYAEKCKKHKEWFESVQTDPANAYIRSLYLEFIEDKHRWLEDNISTLHKFAPALHDLGRKLQKQKNNNRAIECLKKASEQGYSKSQLVYACVHAKKKDYANAVKWLQASAEQANPEAVCGLAICYKSGDGVEKNLEMAFQLFLIAAQQGLPKACYNVGLCLERGLGTPKDRLQSVEWFEKAAKQGHCKSQFSLGVFFYEKGTKEQAAYWFEKASDNGHDIAPCLLGHCYFRPGGIDKDYKKSFKWYLLSATRGFPAGQLCVGVSYYFGRGVPMDYEKAVFWFQKAAQQGAEGAMILLGRCYEFGNGVEQDYMMARQWFEKTNNKFNCVTKWKTVHDKDKCCKEEK